MIGNAFHIVQFILNKEGTVGNKREYKGVMAGLREGKINIGKDEIREGMRG